MAVPATVNTRWIRSYSHWAFALLNKEQPTTGFKKIVNAGIIFEGPGIGYDTFVARAIPYLAFCVIPWLSRLHIALDLPRGLSLNVSLVVA